MTTDSIVLPRTTAIGALEAAENIKGTEAQHTAVNIVHRLLMLDLIEKSKAYYTCTRPPGAAGALIIPADRSGLVYGFVTPPVGSPTCKEVGCEIEHNHCVRTIHAEVNAIMRCAAQEGFATQDAVMFSVLKPCYNCTKLIVQCGIREIYFAGAAYNEIRTEFILKSANAHAYYIDAGLEYGQELVKEWIIP